MRTQTTRTIAGRVNGDGTPASGGEWTSRKVSTGNYQVTVRAPLIAASANPVSFCTAQVSTVPPAPQTFLVATSTANTGAAIDSAFQFTATVAA